jgi:hypothetical protein
MGYERTHCITYLANKLNLVSLYVFDAEDASLIEEM